MRTLVYRITILICLSALVVQAAGLVTLVTDSKLEPPVEHSIDKLTLALLERGYTVSPTSSSEGWSGDLLVVLGVAGSSGPAATALQRLNVPLPQGSEALVIRTTEIMEEDRGQHDEYLRSRQFKLLNHRPARCRVLLKQDPIEVGLQIT